MNSKINYPAVVVSGIVYWLLQAGWYTALSGPWSEGIGKTKEQIMQQGGDSPVPYIVALVCNIVLAAVLAWAIGATGEFTVIRGLSVALVLWLGFVATTIGTNYVFERRSLTLFAINTGCPLLGMMIMAVILGLWRKKAAA
jgi:hypothetical protein